MKNVQYEPDLGPLLLLQLCVFYNCFLLLGVKIVFSTSPAKQSLVGILQISTPLADCSCSNKVKTNKQTKWKQTNKLKTNKQIENKQTKSVSPQKRICAKLLFFLILLMDQFSQSDNIWCGQNSSSLVSFAKVILARYEAVFCWCSRYYSVAALVSRFPMEGEGGSSWRLWSDC